MTPGWFSTQTKTAPAKMQKVSGEKWWGGGEVVSLKTWSAK